MILEFQKVTKNYGSVAALKDASFSIDEGEFVFITGKSGAGKTTLLKLLTRQIKPSDGQIIFDGKGVQKLKGSQIPKLRQSIGTVFQDFKLLNEKTVTENVQMALAIAKVPNKEWKARVDHVLNLVGLAERSHMFPAQLSGGELQRASLARALVVNPKIVFADEPTGNLDWDTAEGVMKLLLKINDEGKTVIVTTHHKKILKEFDKRIIDLKKGQIDSDTKKSSKSKSKK